MSHTIENIDSCTKRLSFNFAKEELAPLMTRALERKRRESSIKGFRRGKVPMSIIQKLFGPQLENSVVQDFAMERASDALEEENFHLAGQPVMDKLDYLSGGDISFEILVEVVPELALEDLSSLSFTRQKAEATEEEVDKFIKENYLEMFGETVELEDSQASLEKGHLAVMNFVGTMPDGSRPESMQGREYLVEVGSGRLIPGFEDGMLGMIKGEERELDLTFPENYHVDHLRGAKVVFSVELLEIKERDYPPMNDKLAREFSFESAQALRDDAKNTVEEEGQNAINARLEREVIDKILDKNSFEVPRGVLQKGRVRVRKEHPQLSDEEVEKKALKNSRETMLFLFLAKKYDVSVGDSEVEEAYERMLEEREALSPEREDYWKNLFREDMFRTKIFEKLLSEVQVLEG